MRLGGRAASAPWNKRRHGTESKNWVLSLWYPRDPFGVGTFSDKRARGPMPRSEHGPWAARRHAAYTYALITGYLPKLWDWAAQSLFSSTPALLGDFIEPACEKKHHQPPEDNEEEPSIASGQLDWGSTVRTADLRVLGSQRHCPSSPPGQ